MYAIIRTGGKQAKVREGDVLDVERLKGDSVEFTPLLVVGKDGNVISDAEELGAYRVLADVLGDTKGDKVDIFKYKNKTGYRRHAGHRQIYTTIKVTKIEAPKKKATKKKATAKADQTADKASADDAASEEA